MATVNWPVELPAGLLMEGMSKQPQNNVIRSKMDAGPAKARRRYTARTVSYSGRQVFDGAELELFESFYHLALADGTLRFNFTDPISGQAAEFRFAEDPVVTTADGLFEVGMNLERL